MGRDYVRGWDFGYEGTGVSVAEAPNELLQVAVEHMGTYVALKQQIDDLQDKLADARETLIEVLYPDGPEVGQDFDFPGLGSVVVAKGRVTEKLDRAVLARAGVDPKLLDSATERKEGDPSVRITVDAP